MGQQGTQMDQTVECIVLAAGQGTRMRATLPKVAHTALGKSLIHWSLDALRKASFAHVTVVVAPAQAAVHELLNDYASQHADFFVNAALQHHANGTGHAAKCAFENIIKVNKGGPLVGQVLIVTGDTPLLRPETLRSFVSEHSSSGHAVSIIAFEAANPTGYGRILTGIDGKFSAIREEKDCSPSERKVSLCNSGIMCIRLELMGDLLGRLDANNAAGEYYLTDVPKHGSLLGHSIGIFRGGREEEFSGVNNQLQLAEAAAVLQKRIVDGWMEKGVLFEDPRLVYVEDSVTFGRDVIVEPFVRLRGHRHFADGSRVRSGEGIQL